MKEVKKLIFEYLNIEERRGDEKVFEFINVLSSAMENCLEWIGEDREKLSKFAGISEENNAVIFLLSRVWKYFGPEEFYTFPTGSQVLRIMFQGGVEDSDIHKGVLGTLSDYKPVIIINIGGSAVDAVLLGGASAWRATYAEIFAHEYGHYVKKIQAKGRGDINTFDIYTKGEGSNVDRYKKYIGTDEEINAHFREMQGNYLKILKRILRGNKGTEQKKLIFSTLIGNNAKEFLSNAMKWFKGNVNEKFFEWIPEDKMKQLVKRIYTFWETLEGYKKKLGIS